jgi:Kef-type K+ transport system membrane component KefB
MLALTCASFDDVIAWCLLAYVIAVAHSQGIVSVLYTIGLTLLFAVGMLLVVRPLLGYVVRHIQSETLQMAICIIMLLAAAYTTNSLGIHPVFGAFLVGVTLPRNVAFTTHIRSLDRVNAVLFLPVYFVFSGLNTQIGLIQGFSLWLICLLILLTACVGKIVGGALATRIVGRPWRDALSLGVLMNTRGLVELIVLNIGLQEKILSPTLFAMLVIMAVVTTMMASPLLLFLGYRSTTTQDEAIGEVVTEVDLEEVIKPS